ncbi:MAG: hypothetical protein ACOX2Z_02865 [Minisyncoccales bacterium]|jgi:hypothetical protein
MEKQIDQAKEKKILTIVLVSVFLVFILLFIFLKKRPAPEIDHRTPEEILIERQTEELREEMKDFKVLTEEDIEEQSKELEDLFDRMGN